MAKKKATTPKKKDPNKIQLELTLKEAAVRCIELDSIIDDIELGLYTMEEIPAKLLALSKESQDLTCEIGIEDLIQAIDLSDKAEELFKVAFNDYVNEEDIEEKAEELGIRKPLKAIDYEPADFHRKLCDVFEVGYFTNAVTLTQMVADKLNADVLCV